MNSLQNNSEIHYSPRSLFGVANQLQPHYCATVLKGISSLSIHHFPERSNNNNFENYNEYLILILINTIINIITQLTDAFSSSSSKIFCRYDFFLKFYESATELKLGNYHTDTKINNNKTLPRLRKKINILRRLKIMDGK